MTHRWVHRLLACIFSKIGNFFCAVRLWIFFAGNACKNRHIVYFFFGKSCNFFCGKCVYKKVIKSCNFLFCGKRVYKKNHQVIYFLR